MNNIIELKREYLNILIEELTPLVYEGLHQMYNDCNKISNDTTVLRNFQTVLKKVCDWDNEMKTKETERILNDKRKKIILAIFKAEIMILSMDYSKIPEDNIEYVNYVHMLYKECAKNFWPLPFLFYDKYTGIEINRNNYEIRKIIKSCIEHSFRRLIPLDQTLQSFLGENINTSEINLLQLLPQYVENKNVIVAEPYEQNNIEQQQIQQTGGNDEKILQIINENIKLSESPLKSPEIKQQEEIKQSTHHNSLNNSSRRSTHKSTPRTSSTLKKIINESINNKYTHESTQKNSVNSEIKNHLMKDLESETLTYNPETNVKNYHDVFSNSEVDNNTYHHSIKDTNKQKFINNYLTK